MDTVVWFTLGIGLAPAYAAITCRRAPDLRYPVTHLVYISETVTWTIGGEHAGVYGAIAGLLLLLTRSRWRPRIWR
jgi:hypothetical protein